MARGIFRKNRFFIPIYRQAIRLPGTGGGATETPQAVTFTGTAAVGLERQISLAKSIAGGGAVAFSKPATMLRAFTMGGAATLAFGKASAALVSPSITATGAHTITKRIGKPLGISGAASVSQNRHIGLLRSVGGTGTTAFLTVLDNTVDASVSGTGSVSFSKKNIFSAAFTYAAAASVALGRSIAMLFGFTGTGTSVLTSDDIADPAAGNRPLLRTDARTLLRNLLRLR